MTDPGPDPSSDPGPADPSVQAWRAVTTSEDLITVADDPLDAHAYIGDPLEDPLEDDSTPPADAPDAAGAGAGSEGHDR